jgi:hypothetical protein
MSPLKPPILSMSHSKLPKQYQCFPNDKHTLYKIKTILKIIQSLVNLLSQFLIFLVIIIVPFSILNYLHNFFFCLFLLFWLGLKRYYDKHHYYYNFSVFASALMFVVIPFQLGWRYGSTSEDVLTGLTIHRRGWRSVYCTPDPPAFLGCAPSGGSATMTQQKRWSIGLLKILLSKNCPIFATLIDKLQFRQCLAYLWLFSWALSGVPELCYATLPVYYIISNSHLLPKERTNHNGHKFPTKWFVKNSYKSASKSDMCHLSY